VTLIQIDAHLSRLIKSTIGTLFQHLVKMCSRLCLLSKRVKYNFLMTILFIHLEIFGGFWRVTAQKTQNHAQMQVTWPKYQMSTIQDGGRLPFWKWFIAPSQPGIIRFQWHLVYRRKFWFGHVSKKQIFANSKWRTAATAILKVVFGYISATYC